MKHDINETKKHLQCLDKNETKFTFQTFNESKDKDLNLTSILHGSIDQHFNTLVDLNKKGAGIYVTVNQTDLKGRKEKNIIAVRSFYLDDDGEVIDPPLAQNMVVHTSKFKRHLYYFINNEEWTKSEWKSFESKLVAKYGGDKNAKDISRVLRLSGFNNMKDFNNPFYVTCEVKSDQPYKKKQILNVLEFEDNTKKAFTPFTGIISKNLFELPETILSGERNNSLFRYTCSLKAKDYNEDTIYKKLKEANETKCIEPISDKELKAIIKSALSYENDIIFYSYTEMGNAERFYNDWQNTAIYCSDEKSWYLWNGKIWEKDHMKQIQELSKKTAKNMMSDAMQRNDEGQSAAVKWARACQSKAKLKATVDLAESVMSCRMTKFNEIDMQLCVQNCIIDLENCTPIKHNKEYYHSYMANVEYHPDNQCPKFIDFLNTTFNVNNDLISYIQRIMGYLLTGDTSEQCIFILLGDGRNGKSTLLNVIIELLGPYHKRANAVTFLTNNKSSIRSDLARLAGSRVVTGSEAGDDSYWDEALIKDISGGEKVTARYLHQNDFEFLPKFKLLIAVNTLPQIKGTDGGIWRRMRIIPFDHIVDTIDVNPHLGDELKQELSGILNFALKGLEEFHKNGLAVPKIITDRTDYYRKEMDRIQSFIEEQCEISAEGVTPVKDMYDHYRQYCENSGYQALSIIKFSNKLVNKGYSKRLHRFGKDVKQSYFGIKLNDTTYDNTPF